MIDDMKGVSMTHPLQWIYMAIVLCLLAYVIIRVLGFVARRYIMITSTDEADDTPDQPPVVPAQQPPEMRTNGFATPQNQHNTPVVHCAAPSDPTDPIKALAQQTGDDPAVIAAVMTVLARVIVHAKRSDGTPKLGMTDGIRYGLGISPGGRNPLYALAREALHQACKDVQVTDSIQDVLPDGTVVRRGKDGLYAVRNGQPVKMPSEHANGL
jgi:hypothetical protein